MRSKVLVLAVTTIVAAAALIWYIEFAPVAEKPVTSIVVKKADDKTPDPVPIARLEPGLRVKLDALPPLTNVLFISRPQITSGEVDKVAKAIRDALHTFRTVTLVHAEPDPEQAGRFRRGPFAIGIGFPVEDELVVITGATASKFDVSLGFFEGKVLVEREKELNSVLSPGSTPTMAMLDFSGVQKNGDQRVRLVLRYAAMIDPSDGRMDTIYWLMEPKPEGYQFVGDTAWNLPRNHTMDWEMHVDGGKVSFGAPKADAFSVTKLPDGKPLTPSAELKAAAIARSFSTGTASEVERLLRELLKQR